MMTILVVIMMTSMMMVTRHQELGIIPDQVLMIVIGCGDRYGDGGDAGGDHDDDHDDDVDCGDETHLTLTAPLFCVGLLVKLLGLV